LRVVVGLLVTLPAVAVGLFSVFVIGGVVGLPRGVLLVLALGVMVAAVWAAWSVVFRLIR